MRKEVPPKDGFDYLLLLKVITMEGRASGTKYFLALPYENLRGDTLVNTVIENLNQGLHLF